MRPTAGTSGLHMAAAHYGSVKLTWQYTADCQTCAMIAPSTFPTPDTRECHTPRKDTEMGIIGWIILGLIAGAIAKFLIPGKQPGGILVTMLIGVVGALLGGWIGSLLFGVGLEDFWSWQTWLIAIIGSVVLLLIWGLIARRRTSA
jgi:uncharacterized membrane protein YeaQ/YmgE (transglycosylase-associated protein family)